MSRSTLLLLIVIGILAALSSWLSREEGGGGLLTVRPPAHIPDYYIAGFSAAAYSADGVPRHRLSAEQMTHFADDASTELSAPRLAFIDEQGETWQLEAGRGEADGSGETLLLADTVSVRRAATTGEAFELRSGDLTVHPKRRFATTRSAVTITAPGTRIKAAGLDAYFDEERLVLYSVESHYEP